MAATTVLRRCLLPHSPPLGRRQSNGCHTNLRKNHRMLTLISPCSLSSTISAAPWGRRRAISLLHSYSASTREESSVTHSSPSSNPGLVFGAGPADSWDGGGVGSPVVKRFVSDDQERWLMWYHGRPASSIDAGEEDSVGLAVSSNGIHWERSSGSGSDGNGGGRVMSRGADWWAFDISGARPSEVLVMSSDKVRAPSSVYWMYYTGFSTDKVALPSAGDGVPAFRSLPGLVISQDGLNWARIEGDHHSGALFDAGAEGEWDSPFVASPRVVYHCPGDLRMYYHSFDPSTKRYAIGMARSRDGIQWVKLGKVAIAGGGVEGSFDEKGVLNAHVVKDRRDGSYLMAYEGVSGSGQRSIGLARSLDGLKEWRWWGGQEALLGPSERGGWDEGGVGCPCLVQMDGEDEWKLYYTGTGSNRREGIGLAVLSFGNSSCVFKRVDSIQHL